MVITTLISQLLVAVPVIIIGTQALTSVFNGICKIDASWARHLVSWIFALIISLSFVATGGLSFGLTGVWEYVVGAVAGILAGGAANGFYDWDAIGKIFDALEDIIRGKENKRKKEVVEEK